MEVPHHPKKKGWRHHRKEGGCSITEHKSSKGRYVLLPSLVWCLRFLWRSFLLWGAWYCFLHFLLLRLLDAAPFVSPFLIWRYCLPSSWRSFLVPRSKSDQVTSTTYQNPWHTPKTRTHVISHQREDLSVPPKKERGNDRNTRRELPPAQRRTEGTTLKKGLGKTALQKGRRGGAAASKRRSRQSSTHAPGRAKRQHHSKRRRGERSSTSKERITQRLSRSAHGGPDGMISILILLREVPVGPVTTTCVVRFGKIIILLCHLQNKIEMPN